MQPSRQLLPQGLLFDFDGTLAPNLDLPDMRRQVIAMTRQTGVPDAVFADCYIVEIIDAARAWLIERGASVDAETYARDTHQLIIDIEMQAATDTKLFAGTEQLLERLRRQDIRLGIVTRNCRGAVLTVCPHLGELVDAIHARDDVTYLKPDTRHLQASLEALNVDASAAAMIGDGGLDMQAGRALNLHCIGVLGGSSDEARLLAAGAHHVLPSVLELPSLFTASRPQDST